MTYVGRGVDAISNVEKLDNITFNGGTTYNLTKSSAAFTPSGANNILVSINGVIQQGNFTVANATIVFDFSPTSNDTCNFIMHYGTGVLNTPADSSVNMAQLGASGTKSSSTFLAGDNSFKTISGTTINNNANNRLISGSGTANTLEGEANFLFDGSTATLKAGSSGASANSGANQLVLESSATEQGISILSPANGQGQIFFGDPDSNALAKIIYSHANNKMRFRVNDLYAMEIDSAGIMTRAYTPCFQAFGTGTQNSLGDATYTVQFGSETFDLNADYNNSTYIFTAPVTGKYQFNVTLNLNNYQTGIGYSWMKLVTSNREHYLAIDGGSHYDAADYNNLTGSVVCDMDSGDTAKAQLQLSGGQASIILGSSSFSGNLVA